MADQGSLRQKLIDLYATHDEAELLGSSRYFRAVFGPDREALVNSQEFQALSQTIKEAKERLQNWEDEYRERTGQQLKDAKAQVVECLTGLLEKAAFKTSAESLYQDQMDVLHDLVIARFARTPPWPDPLKQHFEFLYPKIRDWNLFFLSYTNDGAELLNKEYKPTLDALVEQKRLNLSGNSDYWRDNNLVAEALFQHLRRNNVQKGFYDKSTIRTGDEFEKKIRAACSTSFLFIQLVTRDSLVFSEPNWSFREYAWFKDANESLTKDHKRYREASTKRFLFALGGGKLEQIVPKGFRPPDYKPWYSHIGKVHHEAPSNDSKLFGQAIDNIARSVTTFIEDEWIRAVD